MRLNQFLARAGVCSRREADRYIEDGRVYVNGIKAAMGMQVTMDDEVLVDGRSMSLPDKTVVMAYYKPVGVVCSEKDLHAKRLVVNEIKSDRRLTYAGRLDKDSEGLLIMTDDGSLINAMMKGANKHEKEYIVRVNKHINKEQIEEMSKGLYLEELAVSTRPCFVEQISDDTFRIILTQGFNRQIRRMCEAVGLKVVSLKRTRVMNVELGKMQVGASRLLTEDERQKLYFDCGLR